MYLNDLNCPLFILCKVKYKMHSLRLCNRLRIYTSCLCGNRIREMQRSTKVLVSANLKFMDCKAASSTRQPSSPGNLKHSLNVNDFGVKERFGRKDTVGLLVNSLVHLVSSVSNSQRIYKTELERLLEDVKREGVSVEKYAAALLRCCTLLMPDALPEARVVLAQRIWNLMKEQGVKPRAQHFNALLKCYTDNGHAISIKQFLVDMRSVEPNEETYLWLLGCACEVGDMSQATDVVSSMKDKGYPASELIFNNLVLGHARAGDINNSEAMLDLMKSAGISVTAATYTALLCGYAENSNLEKLHNVRREAVLKGIVFNDRHIMKIVDSLIKSGQPKAVKDVLKWLPAEDRDTNSDLYFMAVSLIHGGHVNTARELLDSVTIPGSEVYLLEEMVRANTPASHILLLADELVSDGRNPCALEKAVRAALIQMKADIALELLEAMKHRDLPLRPHYFWPLIIAATKTEGEKGAFDILKRMQEFGVQPDFDTLQDYVLPRMALVDMEAVVRKLQDHGLGVGEVLSPLIAVTLKLSRLTTATALCDTYKGHLQSDRLVLPLVVAYVTTREVDNTVKMLQEMTTRSKVHSDWAGQFIVNVLIFRKITTEPDQLCSLLKAFQAAGLKISSFAAECLTVHLQSRLKLEPMQKMTEVIESLVNPDINIMPSEHLTTHIPHPKEMLVDDLEGHLLELKSKDMNRRGVLRRLIQEYCRQGNVKSALEAKKEFEESGYKFSAGMLAALFDLMVQAGDLQEAEDILEKFRQQNPELILDEHKVIDYATLLISNHQFEEGLAVLDRHAKQHSVRGGSGVSRNCWRLLTAVAEKRTGAETRKVLKDLVEHGYCSYSNALLGPVIRAYLYRNDLKGAVEEYKHCATQHKATPLQFELTCALLRKGDMTTEFQEILNASSSVHGVPSTYVNLAVALAELGYVKQLRQYLSEGDRNLKGHILEIRCKRLAAEDKLEALATLAQAGKGICYVDLQPVYMSMLQVYSRRGDCDGALALWTSIEEQGEQPSPQFLAALAALLKSHKHDIPFVVPPDVQSYISEKPQSLQFSRVR